MPRIALIYPYFRTRSATEMLFPPLGLATMASHLHARGIETKVFDCTFGTMERLRESLRSYEPDVAGIYSMVSMSRNAFRIAEMIENDFPDCIRVAGGPLPTLYPECYSGRFDAVFRGESDLSFPRFCQDLSGSGILRKRLKDLSLGTYEGLFIKDENLLVDNPAVHYGERIIESFPLPYRGDFDHAAFQKVWFDIDGSRTTSLITTIGCPFHCDFCSKPVFGSLFRRRNLDKIFEEIEQIRLYGYDSLWIADDNFTLNQDFLHDFCMRIIGLGITWSCLSRVTGINEETAYLMKESGCKKVYFGLESGSQATLRLMNKKATLEEGARAVHLFRKAGIGTAGFFIVGYPGETVYSIEDTFRFALSLPLDVISFNVPFPLPGSRLFDRIPSIDKNRDWNEENEITFVYKSEFDPAWLQKRIQQTMDLFANKKNAVPNPVNKYCHA